MSNLINLMLNTDTYKLSMPRQYPVGTEYVYSYIESRGGDFDFNLFFGLQAFIKQYLLTPITTADIDKAAKIITAHGIDFDRSLWDYIVENHNGFLPVTIRAVPEGTVLPVRNALVTIVNTDPACYWLTTHLETAMLRAVWYPTTVATQSKFIKNIILNAMSQTCDSNDGILFKLHDFGARGASSLETAALGGAAHLINFMGTDTIAGICAAMDYYSADVCGYSIPASEHSTATSNAATNKGMQPENDVYNELTYIRTMLKFLDKGNLVAMVADSYDVFNFVDLLGSIKDEIIEKTKGGKFIVVRPDSGVPVEICSALIQKLDGYFGHTVNTKGFKVLNNVRLIQGDGVNKDSIAEILQAFINLGYSIDNIAFGMGGALLQRLDRDTMKFAMKCSAARVNGQWIDVFKDPITDKGKTSKKGRINLWVNDSGEYITAVEKPEGFSDAMNVVFENGKLLYETDFDTIRQTAGLI